MKFDTWLALDDENEIDVIVEYNATYCPAKLSGPWEDSHPDESEIAIVKDTPLGDWPEGLSQQQFDDCVENAIDRLEAEAWEDFASRQEDCE